MITLTDQIALIKRELHAKEIAYPHLVASGKMRHSFTEDDIATMRAVVETLEQVRIKETMK